MRGTRCLVSFGSLTSPGRLITRRRGVSDRRRALWLAVAGAQLVVAASVASALERAETCSLSRSAPEPRGFDFAGARRDRRRRRSANRGRRFDGQPLPRTAGLLADSARLPPVPAARDMTDDTGTRSSGVCLTGTFRCASTRVAPPDGVRQSYAASSPSRLPRLGRHIRPGRTTRRPRPLRGRAHSSRGPRNSAATGSRNAVRSVD